MRARWLFLAVPLLFLVSCDTPMETTDSTDPNFKKPIPLKQSCYDPDDPLCLPGPSPDDPDPNAPGYYIGPDYNMDHCTQSNDLDDDGFDDNCEYRIARRFAPLLATNPGDDTSREPYWVARYTDAIPATEFDEGVLVMYLISYHMDWGDPETGVDDHSGDSEYLVLYVAFDETSEHWVVVNAVYVAHGGPTLKYQNQLQYPDGTIGGYPRVWVANGKHASYTTRRACNEGGVLGADDCSYNVDDERLQVLSSRNLGSEFHQFLNCVASVSPYSYPGTECFWSVAPPPLNPHLYKFCGWDLDRTSCATAYYWHLQDYGFCVEM